MQTRPRIVIISGIPLAGNPRVLKEARTLRRAGYDVTVLGAGLGQLGVERDQSLAQQDGFAYRVVGSLETEANSAHGHWVRLRSRLGRELFRVGGVENRFQLGYFVPELFRQAKALAADYYIVHLEQALWVGAELLRRGAKVGLDFEDWYSEDLTPDARQTRPLTLLKSLERQLLTQARHRTCPSQAMSRALATAYDCVPPEVIYNAFAWSERQHLDGAWQDRREARVPSLHWVSQTLGPGRGLEDLFAALPAVQTPVEIHLRGQLSAGVEEWVYSCVPEHWRRFIFLHPLVKGGELLSRIAEHDLGFAGEMRYCRNKDLTTSNKILHYLLAGLAVVASDTAGQCEIAAQAADAVFVYPSGDAAALAARLNELLNAPERLRAAKAAALRAAEQTFCWEQQAPKLLRLIDAALA